jgi:putative transposase
MSDYRRALVAGGTYFFTVVTYGRRPWLCRDGAVAALRDAVRTVRRQRPFAIDAWVLLPDHMHCIWTLPENDADYAGRWRRVKEHVTRAARMPLSSVTHPSRRRRRERSIWQRRFWEHLIRDIADLAAHLDYIHYNPVKHGLCTAPADWAYSTFHRYVRAGVYATDWGAREAPVLAEAIGRE